MPRIQAIDPIEHSRLARILLLCWYRENIRTTDRYRSLTIWALNIAILSGWRKPTFAVRMMKHWNRSSVSTGVAVMSNVKWTPSKAISDAMKSQRVKKTTGNQSTVVHICSHGKGDSQVSAVFRNVLEWDVTPTVEREELSLPQALIKLQAKIRSEESAHLAGGWNGKTLKVSELLERKKGGFRQKTPDELLAEMSPDDRRKYLEAQLAKLMEASEDGSDATEGATDSEDKEE